MIVRISAFLRSFILDSPFEIYEMSVQNLIFPVHFTVKKKMSCANSYFREFFVVSETFPGNWTIPKYVPSRPSYGKNDSRAYIRFFEIDILDSS